MALTLPTLTFVEQHLTECPYYRSDVRDAEQRRN